MKHLQLPGLTRKATLALSFIALASIAILNSCARTTADQGPKLHAMFDEYWQEQMREFPTWATYLGDKRFDSLLTDISATARDRRLNSDRNYLNRLRAIDRDGLNEVDNVSADIFEINLTRSLEGDKFKSHTMPISQQNGPQMSVANLIPMITFVEAQDYENFHKRMQAFPRLIDQTIENMREGIELGLVSARINIEPVIEQIQSFIVKKPEKSTFYLPIKENKAELTGDVLKDFATKYQNAIQYDIVPAYAKLKKFLQDEYLPNTRTEFGVWSLPDGSERYTYLINYHTTLKLTPEEITQMGKDDLARIHAEMDAIITKVGFEGDRRAFFKYLHSDPKFYYKNTDSLLEGYRAILAAIKPRMSEQFGILPQADCEVKEMESYRAKTAPTAYYNGAAEDGSRPGYFYANTYNLKSRPKYEMEALTYHEAIPGHHLQGSIAQELADLPDFRKHSWFTAYGEGWALYSESLPKEIGFYQDPYSDFGRLIYDAWRACRLVVDCGLHYYKWDRQQAIDFMTEHFGGTDENVISEVDRYIAWPGQALGYKIGQLKILELRAKAKQELGEAFNLPEFHDQILGSGSIPLTALENKINKWIERKKNGSA